MSKTKLYIVGCGNVGGFVAYNFDNFTTNDFEIHGFFDDDVRKHGKIHYGFPVLGGIDLLNSWDQELAVVIGIANPLIKKEVRERISLGKVIFPALISRNAWISKNVKIGNGVIVYPGVSVNYHAKIGDFSIINMNCAVGHDCTISTYSTLAPGVSLGGFTHIEDCCDLGLNVATKQNIRIGKHSIIGGMSMVINDLPENVTAVGTPAKIVKSKT